MSTSLSSETAFPSDLHHPPQAISLHQNPTPTTSESYFFFFNFKRADYDKINAFLFSYNWSNT